MDLLKSSITYPKISLYYMVSVNHKSEQKFKWMFALGFL